MTPRGRGMPTPEEIVQAWVQAFNRVDVDALSGL